MSSNSNQRTMHIANEPLAEGFAVAGHAGLGQSRQNR